MGRSCGQNETALLAGESRALWFASMVEKAPTERKRERSVLVRERLNMPPVSVTEAQSHQLKTKSGWQMHEASGRGMC